MPLTPDTLSMMRSFVRRGFETREQIVEAFCEEIYEPGELDEAEVAVAVDAALATLEKEKASWPKITDCDKLDQAFAALEVRGVIALQNAGLTHSDGYTEIREVYDSRPDRDRILGYCFYHGQALEFAVQGRGLYLGFGPINPEKEQTEGPRVAASRHRGRSGRRRSARPTAPACASPRPWR